MKSLHQQLDLVCENLGLIESVFGVTKISSELEYVEYFNLLFEIEVSYEYSNFFGFKKVNYSCSLYINNVLEHKIKFNKADELRHFIISNI